MITLEFSGKPSEVPRLKAGYEAEEKLAFYLNRAFGEEAYIHVFHGLRVERNGEAAQIDHLVLHRFGFVLVESKSITGKVTINEHAEFTKSYGRGQEGMTSPIKQAHVQAELLRNLLNDHKTKLRGMVGIGPIKTQGEFGEQRFNVIAAISDNSVIEWKGERPVEVKKAEAVVEAIRKRIADHQALTGLGGFINFMTADKKKSAENERNNLYPFTDDEFEKISNFLLASNKPGMQSTNKPSSAAARVKAEPAAARPAPKPSAPKPAAPTPDQPPVRPRPTSVPTAAGRDTKQTAGASNAAVASRNGLFWTKEEKARLREAFQAGKRPEDISPEFGRSAKALRLHAVMLGLIEDEKAW